MEKLFARNAEKLKEKPETLTQIREAIERAKERSSSERSLVARLKTEHIDVIFRRTEEGRVYGATFVDHNSRTVLNGSALGQEYAARAWDEWFKTALPESEQTDAPDITYEPIPAPEPFSAEAPATPHLNRDGEPSLIGETLLDGLDAFGSLFEPEPPPYEYIDPEFRLIQRKKRKKNQRGPRL